METILIMAKALEKASKNMIIDVLSIQYIIDTGNIGYCTLTLVEKNGKLNRDIQSKYMIKEDGTVTMEGR